MIDWGAELAVVLTWLLVVTRLTTALMFSTLVGFAGLPSPVKLIFTLALSIPLAVSCVPVVLPSNDVNLVLMFGRELAVGAALGFGLHVIAAAIQFGGRILDNQIGFSAGVLLNPQTRSFEPLTGSLLLMVAGALFFAMDAHHSLLRGLAYSLSVTPPGMPTTLQFESLLAQFGLVFTFGLLVIAPIFMVLFAVDIAAAVASRSLPQFNIYFVALPLKAALGIFLLGLFAPAFEKVVTVLVTVIFGGWPAILGGG